MKHRTDSNYGENIFYYSSSDLNKVVNGKDAVVAWYAEIKNHVFHKEPKSTGTGHFTQVIWMDSKELGVGVAKNRSVYITFCIKIIVLYFKNMFFYCSKGQTFVVCNYDPAGNFVGKYAAKVAPVGGFKK